MAAYGSFFKALLFFFSPILYKQYFKTIPPRYLHRKPSNNSVPKLQRHHTLANGSPNDTLYDQILAFNVEETLLKSSSLFSYFMLVAFEGGSPFRALVLLVLCPVICVVGRELGLKIMVLVCFLGIRKDKFRVGKAVLPKFLLGDVGLEGFDVVRRFRKRVGITDMPSVMVDGFLRDYLEIDCVVGRELKVFNGRFTGWMEDIKKDNIDVRGIFKGEEMNSTVVGMCSSKKSLNHPLFTICKEVYITSESEKKSWRQLPIQNYPKPMLFHDGRLAFNPTPLNSFFLFFFLPFSIFLSIFRAFFAVFFPPKIATPILVFTGMRLIFSTVNLNESEPSDLPPTVPMSRKDGRSRVYVCNHRTLLDPLYLSFALRGKRLTAVTYSLSRVSEILAPIRTVRLKRVRDQDRVMMEQLLDQGDIVVCPEGTTCREPHLLRFSPLFSELQNDIVPVAMDCHVSMFYGTTAGGFKCLDPLFFLMNPRPSYTVQLLEKVSGLSTCQDITGEGSRFDMANWVQDGEGSRFDMANWVQGEIGKALGFECTRLTRKNKYLILAGNHGLV